MLKKITAAPVSYTHLIPLLLGFLPYLTDMIPSGRSQRRINKVILPE